MDKKELHGICLHFLETSVRCHLLKRRTLKEEQLRWVHRACVGADFRTQLASPIERVRFVVLDTETTGLHAYSGDQVVSVALIELKGLEITGREYSILVNPGRSIPPGATAIHGLTDKDVEASPALETVIADIVGFIGDAIIVGHHIKFDVRFLNKTLRKSALCALRNPCIDTMLLYLSLTGRYGRHTLEDVAQFCGVTIKNRHTAYGDASATARVFRELGHRLITADKGVTNLLRSQGQTAAGL
ncbi:MAG: 3'-5' exonuclease [Gammaproteobacteria bacterium]|nr:3'-5' exonuclease [Gammaproteobacteria bacterium]